MDGQPLCPVCPEVYPVLVRLTRLAGFHTAAVVSANAVLIRAICPETSRKAGMVRPRHDGINRTIPFDNDPKCQLVEIRRRFDASIETLPALQHDPNRPEDVLKVDADEEGVGGDDCADCLRYLVATKSRTVTQRKLRGL